MQVFRHHRWIVGHHNQQGRLWLHGELQARTGPGPRTLAIGVARRHEEGIKREQLAG